MCRSHRRSDHLTANAVGGHRLTLPSPYGRGFPAPFFLEMLGSSPSMTLLFGDGLILRP
ncbi:hypothetical protein BOSEA31B_13607 [Hyphomicrobiales bacterium]|nr:hypothetical protein BOSEA31B_13607 [Hyphomicrobiales bacterium]CAH1699378.1 hypothetical protein BOSEA1005_12431 [Hyphomicrobiales bacterium]CAI0343166.1 hypothetical protein BO1005MUT1_210231 [Hyphomicrobiales bacterium]